MNLNLNLNLNEAETRAELIDPALANAVWGKVDESRVRREVIAPSRLVGGGKRSKADIADYVLLYRGHSWKIEAGFKEIKQEIGSARSQTRDAQAVLNPDFQSICPSHVQTPQNSFVKVLLRMMA